jgi:hypothetical protein
MKRSCQRQTQVFETHDLVGADAIGAQQHDPGSPHVLFFAVRYDPARAPSDDGGHRA